MAITPNTTFTAGAILTATQQNNFPRGVMAYSAVTASDTTITALEQQVTATFTAVANRYYRITYYEPNLLVPATSANFMIATIRPTNTAGTPLATQTVQNGTTATAVSYGITVQAVSTFTAGSTVIIGALSCSSGTGQATRSATQVAFLLIEDIGTA